MPDIRHQIDLTTSVGPLRLRTPLIAASGTVGSVVEMAGVADLSVYGAAVAKSVSEEPWEGKPPPRLAPAGLGMLNGVGIQNAGIDAWTRDIGPQLAGLSVPVWGSAVGRTSDEFARVAKGLEAAGVPAVEINLSCPNLEGEMFSLHPATAAEVCAAVRSATSVPIGAKLSPNLVDPVPVASACAEAGVEWVTLTNTILGAGIDINARRPLLSGIVGGYSGPGLKPIALRFVIEVHRALPNLPIVGCGGVMSGSDVVEFLVAGANAVAAGTIHFAEPRAGERIIAELVAWMKRHRVGTVAELVGSMG
ncbi:dihydroorotate dehydrogenase [soil metagenome]